MSSQSLTTFGNKPKKFNFVHQTVSHQRSPLAGHKTSHVLGSLSLNFTCLLQGLLWLAVMGP